MIGLKVIYIIEDSLFHCSDMNDITCGVPQLGSILGPLLFVFYVNDIFVVSSVLLPILYADDASLFLIGKNINVLIHNMNEELAKVLQWLNCNYPTRHAHNLRVTCKHKTKLSEQSIGTAAISICNHISGNLDTGCSICTFKCKLKKLFNIP